MNNQLGRLGDLVQDVASFSAFVTGAEGVSPEAIDGLARAYERNSNPVEADQVRARYQAQLRDRLGSDSEDEGRMLLSWSYSLMARGAVAESSQKAQEAFDLFLRTDPDSLEAADAAKQLGEARFRTGQWQAAASGFERALQIRRQAGQLPSTLLAELLVKNADSQMRLDPEMAQPLLAQLSELRRAEPRLTALWLGAQGRSVLAWQDKQQYGVVLPAVERLRGSIAPRSPPSSPVCRSSR